MMADINNPKVMQKARENPMTAEIVEEVRALAQDKEVQKMLLAEKYAVADFNAAVSYAEEKGAMKTLYELVESGDISIERGAAKANLSVEQFKKNMILTGHKVEEVH